MSNKKTYNHGVDDFLDFESKNDLFNYQINNIKIWHFIRFEFYRYILIKNNIISTPHDTISISFLKRLMYKVRDLKYLVYKNPLLSKQRDVLVLNHQRRVKNNGVYECLYTDYLLSNLNKNNYVVLENEYQYSHYKPTPTKNLFYMEGFSLVANIRKLFYKNKIKKHIDTSKIEQLLDIINSHFNLNKNDNEIIKKMITNIIISYKVNYPLYNRLLCKIKPKVIIEVVSYGSNRYIINDIAKKLKIPTIELQHGIMGKYEIAYNFKDKIHLSTFPDYIFTFGQFWKDNTRLPIKDENVKSVGWPYFEKKVNHYKSNKNIKNAKKTILFISQGIIGSKLSKTAVELNELVSDGYKIIYKLHPGEFLRWKREYPWLIESSINVIDHNNYDIHYYFAQADIQVGAGSTALFEGLGYNLATYILPFHGYKNMEVLIEKQMVQLVSNSKELFSKIIESKNSVIEDINYIWSSDAINKMIDSIDNVLKDYYDKSIDTKMKG